MRGFQWLACSEALVQLSWYAHVPVCARLCPCCQVKLPHVDWGRVLEADLQHAPSFKMATGYERLHMPAGIQVRGTAAAATGNADTCSFLHECYWQCCIYLAMTERYVQPQAWLSGMFQLERACACARHSRSCCGRAPCVAWCCRCWWLSRPPTSPQRWRSCVPACRTLWLLLTWSGGPSLAGASPQWPWCSCRAASECTCSCCR